MVEGVTVTTGWESPTSTVPDGGAEVGAVPAPSWTMARDTGRDY
jgi:hypothetical protein